MVFDRERIKRTKSQPLTCGIFQAAVMRNLKGSQFLLRFVTAEREAIPNAARKHTATVTKHIEMRTNQKEIANAQTKELQIASPKSRHKFATHLFFPFPQNYKNYYSLINIKNYGII